MSATTVAPTVSHSAAREVIDLLGRVLLVALFMLSGVGKITGYESTASYMASVGVPAVLLPATIVLEIGGAVAIVVGWRTRHVAMLLAGFSILTALTFHSDFSDQIQMIMFLKNMAIAGGFLLLVARGAGRYSLDARTSQ